MAPLRHSLWCKSPLTLTADHCPLRPLPCCGTALRAGGDLHGHSACVRRLAMAQWPPPEVWMASEALPDKALAVATSAPPRLSLRVGSSLHPPGESIP